MLLFDYFIAFGILSTISAASTQQSIKLSNTLLNGTNGSQAANQTNLRNKRSACLPNPCGTYGICYDIQYPSPLPNQFRCVCSAGFTGNQCEREINECLSSPCKNGNCFDLIDAFYCNCNSGFTGKNCETDLSSKNQQCEPNSCGDGECQLTTHPTYPFVCKCRDGTFKFEPCTTVVVISKCAAQPCYPNLCIDAPNSPSGYLCQCGTNDYRPSSCQTNLCDKNPCQNGASCVSYNATETWCNPSQAESTCCICPAGFTGLKCETDIDECSSSPCRNGAICNNLLNQFSCNCPVGYTGVNCERQIGCKTNPCRFGGTCVLAADGTETCKCKDGFTGSFCEIDINECLSSPCQNGGTCIDLENSYACYCPDGYFRPTFCPPIGTPSTAPTTTSTTTTTTTTTTPAPTTRVQSVTSCLNNICFNGGSCYIVTQSGQTGFVCMCKPGYSGDLCQTSEFTTTTAAANRCLPNPCFHGGVCTSKGCICPSGYSGQFCEVLTMGSRCSEIQCMNGGTCEENTPGISTYAYCVCKPGFTGPRCETEYFRCKSNGIFSDIYGCDNGRYLECAYYGQVQVGFPNGILYRRDCPPGLRYNPAYGYCDYASNVECSAV